MTDAIPERPTPLRELIHLLRLFTLWLVASLALTGQALGLEVGAETGPLGTIATNVPQVYAGTSSTTAGSALGLFLEQSLALKALGVDFWADVLTPLTLDVGLAGSASYLPVDVGVRAGYLWGHAEPYVGLCSQLAILVAPIEGGPSLHPVALGVGGDLGMDFAAYSFRVGLEVRVIGLVTSLQDENLGEGAFEFAGFLSFRYQVIP